MLLHHGWGHDHRNRGQRHTGQEARLETAESLTNFLALIAVVSWRIFFLTTSARTKPDAALDVWSRHLVVRICGESAWLYSPCFADSFVRREAFEGLQPLGEVVGVEELV